jgi:hypothetical protein
MDLFCVRLVRWHKTPSHRDPHISIAMEVDVVIITSALPLQQRPQWRQVKAHKPEDVS